MAPRQSAKKNDHKSGSSGNRNRDSAGDPLNHYLREISKIKPLSREEEAQLGEKIARGNVKALHDLVRRNLKYVVSVANKYRGCGLSLQDLIEEGNIGLIQAAKRFDPARHVKFITYAVWWIRQAIMHALAEQAGTVKLPIKQVGKIYKIGKKRNDLTQALEREPTQSELAKGLGFKEEDITSLMRAYRTYVSLDAPLRADESTLYIDLLESPNTIPYDDQIMQEGLKAKVEGLLKGLTAREEMILRLRFGFNGEAKTLEEIG
ncbi:MAG: sigma-70 family RNA polymerase sigma factor, partial [Nitrospinaceae bacterium]|nr:RNA polymerase sigma factor RpoD/SigA [Nitrospinaceae bacterium]NIR54110.1 RNA polymerase sigma factor RpoD/SigA [Nitrospinaceae bacterium]NIS84530.1 RNA polymerase sigma factor RpoD/SigA [Nitrospinaceae bacterium]NIT81322.1 RNA polymerase sigma factor RpoD/SigA [Nitrospinaceae bacterium]NIU43611.1 RNA polymerase sigma factor RpoD/SigA [Nitrospinaceae bacterium]